MYVSYCKGTDVYDDDDFGFELCEGKISKHASEVRSSCVRDHDTEGSNMCEETSPEEGRPPCCSREGYHSPPSSIRRDHEDGKDSPTTEGEF
ncbi:hypothetical protein ACOMHN_044040 [Nucella lapillus]